MQDKKNNPVELGLLGSVGQKQKLYHAVYSHEMMEWR